MTGSTAPRGTDVLVIGAGAIGAAISWYCTLLGLSVRVVDRGAPGGGTSSRCEGNILVSDKERGPELDLARYSLGLWHGELAEHGRRWELERKGGIIVASRESSLASLRRALAAQREHGIEVQELDAAELASLEPYASPEAVGAALYPDDSQVMPMLVVAHLLALARDRGAEVLEHCEVTGMLREGERVVGARTTRGDLPAGAVVNAAGPWAAQLAALAGVELPIAPRRGYVMVTEPLPPRVFHKVYAAEYIDDVGTSEASLQSSPVVEGTPAGTLLLGSSREQVGFSETLGREALRRIAHNAAALFPFLREVRVLRHYHGFRPYSPDHVPAIGPDARAPGLWHASGHEGAGIGLSVGTGKLLAQALAGDRPDLDLSPFDPSRFGPGGTA
ncbi:D-amino-acid oxidase [Brachybacterium faecium]|uniref:Glycine/D-amino acid oxidase, deaminating n=1 Tax=Brachybacterium faecium (strain ATCC 43885 / DSM 4810 / JCM 11609 / LMG 19847 / NBRC 14762 / NCIMB 9860 / 6-10) TaxID=446465 RepID=C7MB33_BRAFD|nr:FAD-binding oxidoreductase [Brachybacterium faecium]ACU86920.1 glycine/D-amino acid oxidase, deaminating [Brachybacterium faecium DSM 4810]SLN00048.1 D-amino-acid oxidase [Brachybacterium faecium]HJG51651.1 FAD-binding oxidoreductase [Brachybacterium faecium]